MEQTFGERLIGLLSDPLFWLVTIFLGIVLSVIGNYATRISDRILSLFSKRRQEARKRREDYIDSEARRLISRPQERFDAKLDEIYLTILSMGWLMLFTAIMIFVAIVEITSFPPHEFRYIFYLLVILYGCMIVVGLRGNSAKRREVREIINRYYEIQQADNETQKENNT